MSFITERSILEAGWMLDIMEASLTAHQTAAGRNALASNLSVATYARSPEDLIHHALKSPQHTLHERHHMEQGLLLHGQKHSRLNCPLKCQPLQDLLFRTSRSKSPFHRLALIATNGHRSHDRLRRTSMSADETS